MKTAVIRCTVLSVYMRHQQLAATATLVVICMFAVSFGNAVTLNADPEPQWPDTWMLLDEDPEDTTQDYRDVLRASYACDDSYIYLRLNLVAPPDFSTSTRYKWFFGIGGATAIERSGNIIENATHLLFVEDTGDDATTETYVLDSHGDDTFDEYEPLVYVTTPGPASSDMAGCRVVDNNIDLYVSLGQLGLAGTISGVQLTWATDTTNPNLAQAAGDTPDDSDIPLVLRPAPSATLTAAPEPVDAGGVLTYTATVANDGTSPLVDASGNEFEVVIPANTAFVEGSVLVDGVPDAGVAYDAGSRLMRWNGTIPAGSQMEIEYQVTVDSPLANGTVISSQATVWCDSNGDGVNDVSILSDDPDTSLELDPCVSTVASAPVLVLDAPDRLRTVRAGGRTTYSITIENRGNDVATDPAMELALPPELSIAAAEPSPVDDGSTIWSAASLSPLDGVRTVRVTLEVMTGLWRDRDLVSCASAACAEGASDSVTTIVPHRIDRDDDDEHDDRPPQPRETDEEAQPPALPEPPADEPEPPLPAPFITLDGGSAAHEARIVWLANVPLDGIVASLFFAVPEDVVVTRLRLRQGCACFVEGNRVGISCGPGLKPTEIAEVAFGPATADGVTSATFNLAVCPLLYAVIRPASVHDGDGSTALTLSIFNAGDCTASDLTAYVGLPAYVSVVRATAEDTGIVSVTGSQVIATPGPIEPGSDVAFTLVLVDRDPSATQLTARDLFASSPPSLMLRANGNPPRAP